MSSKGQKPEQDDNKKKSAKSGKAHTVIVIDEPVKIEFKDNWLRIFKVKNKNKAANPQKQDRLEAKRLAKEAKVLYKSQKKEQRVLKNSRQAELEENLGSTTKLDSKKISQDTRKKIRVKKLKDKDQKVDFKQATREFPVKMIKEVNKIKWSGAENLTKKYITVIVFMAVFAIAFFFIDWGLQALFALMKVV